jgi:coenzyme F420-reducing hydrogenase delta subunit
MNKSATIIVFVCNWDGLTCIEAASQKRMAFPASVMIIRVKRLSEKYIPD